jgi:hypothetical protein
VRGGWSLALVLLWSIALGGVLLALRRPRGQAPDGDGGGTDDAPGPGAQAVQPRQAREYARLMLLVSAALWLLLFAFSAAAQSTPRASARYLACLPLAAPAVLWPLWQSLGGIRERIKRGQRYARGRFALSAVVLSFIAAVNLVGTGDIVANLAASQGAYNQTNTLIQALRDRGATRVYSDYATCSLLMFQSGERVICAVLDDQLRPGVNRYPPYLAQVSAAPHAAYLFPVNSLATRELARRMGEDTRVHVMRVATYVLYYDGSP